MPGGTGIAGRLAGITRRMMARADSGGEATRWSASYAALVAVGGCLAFLPVPFWVTEIWLGGLLGGAAAGLLTVPFCFVLVALVVRRPEWSAPGPDRTGVEGWLLVLLGLHAAGLLWARSAWDAVMVCAVALIPAVWLWSWGALGFGRARQLLMPIFFGYFALPWEHFLRKVLDVPLQSWTADIAYAVLNLIGYQVRYYDAYTIYTWHYYIIVNETCSGMNMLTTLAMYTVVFGWMVQPRIRERVLLLLLVVPVAMFANGLRVATLYLMGHYGGDDLAMGPWHDRTAYLWFLPVFWFLFVVSQALTKAAIRRKATTPIHQSPQRT